MKIVLIADDNKKNLMQNFCIAYRGILSKQDLYATDSTGRVIEEVSNLIINKFHAGFLGGDEQIATQIEQNNIDMVIYLRDASSPNAPDRFVHEIIRLCDFHNIPIATNLSTAELLIHGLERGDLEWRNYL